MEYENLEFKRVSSDVRKAQEKLQGECELLRIENQELKKLLGEKDAEIQDLSLKLDELQNNKLSGKHSRFSSLRHNFQNIFHRRRTKDELVSKKILQSIPEIDESPPISLMSNQTPIFPTDEPNFRTTLEKMDKDADYKNVPLVLVEAVKVLEAKFMNVIGLYRVSGNYAVVQDMRFHVRQIIFNIFNNRTNYTLKI